MMDLRDLSTHLNSGGDLTADAIRLSGDFLLDANSSVEDRADFLQALHTKGETPEEVTGFVEMFLERSVKPPFSGDNSLDVCGTGGDRAGFFNISTTVMFVTAGAGVRIVKHGNRGITSKSGGADVLEALGVRIDLSPDAAASALDKAGCCFLFAPAYHPAFRAVAPVRQALAARGSASIFNIIGPLLNPARPSFQLAGVYDPTLLPTYAAVFQKLGRRRAWAVHGTGPDGFRVDEVSPIGATLVHSVSGGDSKQFIIDPNELPLPKMSPSDLAGGDAMTNAKILRGILDASIQGPPRAVVQLNAAAAICAADKATDMKNAWDQAGESIDSGNALQSLENLRSFA
ncbi:MAG: anthranilate phosphoribosyltransferase [Spartobacteria bacterium Tous-C9RFEB]|nr:MAG: anthranilate phosphoribosyltransferase [Spartobacteria bacterium Tous-C9RFEB]